MNNFVENTERKILSVNNLKKNFGSAQAVDNISFSVSKNEIVGLLGPNGAGKTTTINMILGILEPTSGDIEIDGINIQSKRSQALSKTNFAAVYAPLLGNLSVYENLKVFGLLYDVKNIKDRIAELLKEYNLEKFKNTKCGVMSSGEQTRVSLAKAMLNTPKLLLLDEPTASLDPSTAQEVRSAILEFAKSGDSGVLWTSHNMYEVNDVCDRVLFLSGGKVLLEGNPKTLPEEHGMKTLEELFIAVARDTLNGENSDAI